MTDIATIEAAARRMAGRIRRTPLLSAPALDRSAGRRILMKAECLQVTGSFKARGAWSAISALDPEVRARGILAYSSGNHAQGVAWAAAAHGVPATIVMPSDAPAAKIAGTRGYGAEVVTYDRARASREAIGRALAAERGLTLIAPYDHPEVIAGQGSVGLEIAEQAADLGIARADVLICCGGGGLSSGIALALAARAPGLIRFPVDCFRWSGPRGPKRRGSGGASPGPSPGAPARRARGVQLDPRLVIEARPPRWARNAPAARWAGAARFATGQIELGSTERSSLSASGRKQSSGFGIRPRTVEPEGFDDMARSLASGERQRNPRLSGSICDAILTPEPGELTFPILLAHAGPGLAVRDGEALAAMALAFGHLKIVVEPGGAVALAAALFRAEQIAGDAVVAVASGGNVDAALFAEAIAGD